MSGFWPQTTNASGTESAGALRRIIQALAGPIVALASDSGRIVAPIPLAIAAQSMLCDSISPITFGVSWRSAIASSTRSRTTSPSRGKNRLNRLTADKSMLLPG
ncbi:hypothetical protein D3C76_1511750 [compost metagenome]